MNTINRIVIESCQEILRENSDNIVVDKETKLGRDNGIDSLGMVTLILLLEEKLGINLDNYLTGIRRCKNVEELVNVLSDIEIQ